MVKTHFCTIYGIVCVNSNICKCGIITKTKALFRLQSNTSLLPSTHSGIKVSNFFKLLCFKDMITVMESLSQS